LLRRRAFYLRNLRHLRIMPFALRDQMGFLVEAISTHEEGIASLQGVLSA